MSALRWLKVVEDRKQVALLYVKDDVTSWDRHCVKLSKLT